MNERKKEAEQEPEYERSKARGFVLSPKTDHSILFLGLRYSRRGRGGGQRHEDTKLTTKFNLFKHNASQRTENEEEMRFISKFT